MTQSNFIKNYCERRGVTEVELNKEGRVAVPCDCGDEDCLGWAMVDRCELKTHVENNLYSD